jgi:hypothetical protein
METKKGKNKPIFLTFFNGTLYKPQRTMVWLNMLRKRGRKQNGYLLQHGNTLKNRISAPNCGDGRPYGV